MTLVGFLLLILIGAVVGALAQVIVGFSAGGFIASIVVGFLGALIGTWIAREVGLPQIFSVTVDGYTVHILWAILGAIVLLLPLALIRGRAYRSRL